MNAVYLVFWQCTPYGMYAGYAYSVLSHLIPFKLNCIIKLIYWSFLFIWRMTNTLCISLACSFFLLGFRKSRSQVDNCYFLLKESNKLLCVGCYSKILTLIILSITYLRASKFVCLPNWPINCVMLLLINIQDVCPIFCNTKMGSIENIIVKFVDCRLMCVTKKSHHITIFHWNQLINIMMLW